MVKTSSHPRKLNVNDVESQKLKFNLNDKVTQNGSKLVF